jgi:hypothetical protein
MSLPSAAERLRLGTAAACGVAAAAFLVDGARQLGLASGALALAAAAAGQVALHRGVGVLPVAYGVLVVAAFAGMFVALRLPGGS